MFTKEKKGSEAPAGGELAQVVERSLSMREAVGSTPTFSRFYFPDPGSPGGAPKSPDPLSKKKDKVWGVLNAAVTWPFPPFLTCGHGQYRARDHPNPVYKDLPIYNSCSVSPEAL